MKIHSIFDLIKMKNKEIFMINIPEIFGSMVFNESVMRKRLPKDIYNQLQDTIKNGTPLDVSISDVVANAMKDWAIEKGATHFTHWFQPMIGITAEKHDGFIAKAGNSKVLMDFSGKELIHGEPDASSFPSGGLRNTFEARGYTTWDPTSYAFVKDNALYIPTAFCSYSGESLDKKTPLLKSMQLINKHALRILRLFGNTTVHRVFPTVGAEQEYFLIDKKLYEKREDLIFCGRTLFGAPSAKGQDLEDHYFGSIRPRVSAFMKDLDTELWKLGVLAKTKHNEVAPAQHELAQIFTTANIATDHNQLTMEIMKTVAERHGLICLLHEKPFNGVNGSGKHNNWSLSTDTGLNLLEPGTSPHENVQFLLFLCAVIKAVDEYQDLLRASVASAGNDHRLGSSEAPPPIISIFLGQELTEVLTAIETGAKCGNQIKTMLQMGVDILPKFQRDNTDRNRTSPFAFTGNKFEFRMVGSNLSIGCPNIMLNTIVAEELSKFADILESCDNFKESLNDLIVDTIKRHKRIIFNGNNYSEDWIKEAEKRSLVNLPTAVDAIPHLLAEKNVKLFLKHGLYTEAEIRSRHDILMENYFKVIRIEARVMIEMVRKQIFPTVSKYIKILSDSVTAKRNISNTINCEQEEKIITLLSNLQDEMYMKCLLLERNVIKGKVIQNVNEKSDFYKKEIIPVMQKLREIADKIEAHTDKDIWPYPSYSDILFSV